MTQESKFSFPTETVKLPSQGLVYSKDNPLSSGEVEIKYMTAKEEDILTNANYIRANTVLDKLLQSLVVSKVNLEEMTVEDRDALLVAARILGYGKDYSFRFSNPSSGKEETVTVDLSTLKDKLLERDQLITEGVNEMQYVIPSINTKVTYKFLTVADEKAIEKEILGLQKISQSGSFDISTRLKFIITSVNGDRTPATIRDFVDNHLLARASRELRKHIKDTSPGVQLKFDFVTDNYTEEGVDIPLTINFFWPEL
jgi:hypothetical protein